MQFINISDKSILDSLTLPNFLPAYYKLKEKKGTNSYNKKNLRI